MTEKQEEILNSAIQLFAKEGYNAVSTRSIAHKAGVSEGLISDILKVKKDFWKVCLKLGSKGSKKPFYPLKSSRTLK